MTLSQLPGFKFDQKTYFAANNIVSTYHFDRFTKTCKTCDEAIAGLEGVDDITDK